ncbi:unnamed protein product [Vitrella brassicaformis CCMP3155]|uniref:Uncharacterized protein n=1 Tax=Vitrella brassicaformis (strain CCMP3155) TaxID=1169540 RepID=A0A0G4ES42_VITBC|nr:unnamed protein product [Vitrella brassicaformis CCMP3155]|eukprot:CEM00722.1 unnamed protein product [Vitrella brassicaformis CCMP3155]
MAGIMLSSVFVCVWVVSVGSVSLTGRLRDVPSKLQEVATLNAQLKSLASSGQSSYRSRRREQSYKEDYTDELTRNWEVIDPPSGPSGRWHFAKHSAGHPIVIAQDEAGLSVSSSVLPGALLMHHGTLVSEGFAAASLYMDKETPSAGVVFQFRDEDNFCFAAVARAGMGNAHPGKGKLTIGRVIDGQSHTLNDYRGVMGVFASGRALFDSFACGFRGDESLVGGAFPHTQPMPQLTAAKQREGKPRTQQVSTPGTPSPSLPAAAVPRQCLYTMPDTPTIEDWEDGQSGWVVLRERGEVTASAASSARSALLLKDIVCGPMTMGVSLELRGDDCAGGLTFRSHGPDARYIVTLDAPTGRLLLKQQNGAAPVVIASQAVPLSAGLVYDVQVTDKSITPTNSRVSISIDGHTKLHKETPKDNTPGGVGLFIERGDVEFKKFHVGPPSDTEQFD